jgi:regulator of cell morphogenesis and NO signaling
VTLAPTLTVARLAAEHPHAIPVLERHRIDYCCKGNRPLAEACAKVGLSVDDLAAEVEAARPRLGAPVDWTRRDLGELIDHIVATHHEPLPEMLDRLVALARKVAAVHGPKDPARLHDLVRVVTALRDDLVPHLRKEEEILFPWIRDGRGESAGGPIHVMQEEHDDVGELLRKARRLTDDYTVPAEACGSWRALWVGLQELEEDLHTHIHLENNVLFPRALA